VEINEYRKKKKRKKKERTRKESKRKERERERGSLLRGREIHTGGGMGLGGFDLELREGDLLANRGARMIEDAAVLQELDVPVLEAGIVVLVVALLIEKAAFHGDTVLRTRGVSHDELVLDAVARRVVVVRVLRALEHLTDRQGHHVLESFTVHAGLGHLGVLGRQQRPVARAVVLQEKDGALIVSPDFGAY
jgi:hypothetical protein